MGDNAVRSTSIWRLALVILIELAYAVVTRTWVCSHWTGIERELVTTGFRIVSACCYWRLFRDMIRSRTAEAPTRAMYPVLILAVSVIIAQPILVGEYSLPDIATKAIFFITSIIVAVREEWFYRGIIQNLAEHRFGWWGSILVSNAAFTVYHYGTQPYIPSHLVALFSVGCMLGCVYYVTGSLVTVIVIHAADDAVWAFSPFLSKPVAFGYGNLPLIPVMFLCFVWGHQKRVQKSS